VPIGAVPAITQTAVPSTPIPIICTNCAPPIVIRPNANGIATPPIGLQMFGGLPVRVLNPSSLDPCVDPKVATSFAISQATSTQIVTGQVGKRALICHALLVGADAENLSLVEGTGSTCGTNTLAVVGGTTAANGLNFAANVGANVVAGATWFAVTQVPGNNLCLLQSGTGRVAGSIKVAFINP